MSALVVLCTASKVEEAEKIAQALVEERLAACVNLVPQIDSRYWWQGQIESGQEVLLIMKTLSSQFKALSKRIQELHSYTVPEVIALPIKFGSQAYLKWMNDSLKKERKRKK